MSRPNIIVVFADQLRYDSLACNGNRIVRTPHLDRLAREGVNCNQAVSNCPICSPFRASLMTGRHAHGNGVICNQYRLRDDQAFLPACLGEAGYRTAWVGKWHMGGGPYRPEDRYGFDDMLAYNCNHHYYDVSYWRNEEGPFPICEYAPRGETSLLLDWVDEQQREHGDQPFAAVMSWGPPHWTGSQGGDRDYGCYPQEYNHYDPSTCDPSPNVPPMLHDYARREWADYCAMTESLDDLMGVIMAYLDQRGLADNTIVCFTSDHGDHLSSHGYGKPGCNWMPPALRGSKATPFEESVCIPMIWRWPAGLPKMRQDDSLIGAVDLMPTLLGLAGVDVPAGLHGVDASACLRGKDVGPTEAYLEILGTGWPARCEWLGLWRGIRDERYTYARWAHPTSHCLLFDRQNDPWQQQNLVDSPDHAALRANLEQRLQDCSARYDDPFDSGERLPVTGMLRLGQRFIDVQPLDQVPAAYLKALLETSR